jgi:flagellar basal body rod protein FlgC
MSIPALSNATFGMARATSQLQHSANQIARLDGPNGQIDIGREMINVMTAETDFKANVKVASAAQNMTKSLLDILA